MRLLKYLLRIRRWVRISHIISSKASLCFNDGLFHEDRERERSVRARMSVTKKKKKKAARDKASGSRSHIHLVMNVY